MLQFYNLFTSSNFNAYFLSKQTNKTTIPITTELENLEKNISTIFDLISQTVLKFLSYKFPIYKDKGMLEIKKRCGNGEYI